MLPERFYQYELDWIIENVYPICTTLHALLYGAIQDLILMRYVFVNIMLSCKTVDSNWLRDI